MVKGRRISKGIVRNKMLSRVSHSTQKYTVKGTFQRLEGHKETLPSYLSRDNLRIS